MDEENKQGQEVEQATVAPPKRKSLKKFYAFAALTLANLFAASAASFAWFIYASQNTDIATVSGDLNVQIDKVTAYKYVYPYYTNSTTFINYDVTGPDSDYVKAYVIEDASVTGAGSATSTTITLGTNDSSSNRVAPSSNYASATTLYYEHVDDFRYYLMGDNTFTGVSENPWSALTATAFASKQNIIGSEVAELYNIVISKGAEFVLFDRSTIQAVPNTSPVQNTCTYYTYDAITADSPFAIEGEGTKIKCLKSGIYDFRFFYDTEASKQKLTISKSASRPDDAIIGNNMLDPTKITIDHAGGKYPGATLLQCLPQAIQEQKTMVVLDVELRYKNANKIKAGIKVQRSRPPMIPAEDPATAAHIYNLTNRYNNTTAHLTGYVDSLHRNQLYASDFYAFYAEFAKGGQDGNAYATPAAAWTAIHAKRTNAQTEGETPRDYFTRFKNDGDTYDSVISDYEMFATSGNEEDMQIPASAGAENLSGTYHCYVAVDYDYARLPFFLNADRLGKTYVLDRDFGFHFTAEQWLESEEGA